ncbi:MAG: pyridoxamine 5'-phosphate oxidase family protein [Anaerolineae bacterium]|nr:pyridoxamine 5'-phosphate oxidase family protein [Anaerolineae bacterium]
MRSPKVGRPLFPKGYVENPSGLLSWSHVVQRLTDAKNYWLCTVRPDGRPHVIPKWAVWVDDKIYFDGSSETRHARNIAANPRVALHLESGDDVVIVEGVCRVVSAPSSALGVKLAQAYAAKYAEIGYAPSPDQWDTGGLFEIIPYMALAWTSFAEDPTKFVLDNDCDTE